MSSEPYYVKVKDPRCDINSTNEQSGYVLFGGSRVTDNVIVADSAQLAPSQPINALFTVNPPSTMTIVDRDIRIRAYFEIETDQPVQLGINDALRQFPLNSIIDVSSVQINGENVSENSGDKLHALYCYHNSLEDGGRVVSTSPSYPDQYQQYSDWTKYGTAKNPLSKYGENATMQGPRGGFVIDRLGVAEGQPLTKFRVVVTESLQLSPFDNAIGPIVEGMVNVNQLNINLRFKSDVSRILSHSSAGNAITDVNVTFYQVPEVLVRYITPLMTQKVPDIQHLSYYSDQDYIKSIPTISPGDSFTLYSDTIKLGQIPESLYIFGRRSRQTSNYSTCDSFLSIESIQILFNNESGLFSTSTKQDLYEICSRNGSNQSWPGWSYYRGGPLRLVFGKDIGLPDYLAMGCQTQATIQIRVEFKNNSDDNFDGELYTIYRNIGTFSVFENGARASVGNLTPDIVKNVLERGPALSYHNYKEISGGSFWTKMKSLGNKISHMLQKSLPVIEKVAEQVAPQYAPAIGVANKLVGGGRLAGGRIRRRHR